MWLAGIGILVVVSLWVVLWVLARLAPAGRMREYLAFAPNCVILLRRVRRDQRLPLGGRLVLACALAYVLSPIQLIPNFIPVIGQIDDFVVVTAALRYACRRLPRADVLSAWPGDPHQLDRLLGVRTTEIQEASA